MSKELPFGELLAADEIALRQYSRGALLSVDLGTLCGRSARILAEASAQVVSIDLFEYYNLIHDHQNNTHYESLFKEHPHSFNDVRKALSCVDNIAVLRGPTAMYARYFQNVDCLFVDADHSFEGVKEDAFAWLPCLSPGGYALFHDADPTGTWPGVSEALAVVVNPMEDMEYIGLLGVTAVYRKRGGVRI